MRSPCHIGHDDVHGAIRRWPDNVCEFGDCCPTTSGVGNCERSDLSAKHSGELQEANWDPDGPEPGLGARILGRNQHPKVGEWSTTSFVIAWEEGALFSWAVSDTAQPSASWSFELAPSDEGTTLTQRVQLGPGPSGLTPAIEAMPDREEDIVARRLSEHDANMAANLQAVKAALES